MRKLTNDHTVKRALWFDKLGLIKAYNNKTKENFYYVGEGKGVDESWDIDFILNWGSKYTEEGFKMRIDYLMKG